jgi:HAD superfamily hydrolase (TIGR01509 family)
MPVDLVIYDCDGTLIDTETVYAEVVVALCREAGLTSWTTEDYARQLVGIPLADGIKIIEAALGRPLRADFEERAEAGVAARLARDARGLPGVRQAVTQIPASRCVASSTALEPLRHNLALAGLIDLFDPHVFSASQVARGKPEPDVFLFAAERMSSAPERCLVLEDSVPGVLAARAAGMRVVGFTGACHDKDGTRTRLLAAGVALVLDDYADWPRVVAGLSA